MRVATYNVRIDPDWYDRRLPEIYEVIETLDADLLGLQECKEWMFRGLKNLEMSRATPRDFSDRPTGQGTPVLFSDNLDLRETRYHPLTDDWSESGYDWDSAWRRGLFVLLFDDFLWINTHLDNEGERARREGVERIRQIVEAEGMPSIVTMDGNFENNSEEYQILSEILTESKWRDDHEGPRQTLMWDEGGLKGERDYVWTTGEIRESETHTGDDLIYRSFSDGPSDHLPVVAEIDLV